MSDHPLDYFDLDHSEDELELEAERPLPKGKRMNELSTISDDIITSLVINGDLKRLTPPQKVAYYRYRCQQAGLDPAAKPFDLLVLNGKEILYANAGGCQQLCSVHKLSTQITHREKLGDIYCVSARVTGADKRSTENMGSVHIGNAQGDGLANALMKATTKAIRRTVLSHVGLGMLEDSEVDTIPGAVRAPLPASLTTSIEDKYSSEPKYPMHMPDPTTGTSKVYASYPNLIEWEKEYQSLINRLENSDKLNAEGKIAMKMALHQANIDTLNTIIDIEKNNAGVPDL